MHARRFARSPSGARLDAETTMRVGEALIDLLATHYGVDVAFGIPGVHNI